MSTALKDQFALLESRDAWFGDDRATSCAGCKKRKHDVGEFEDLVTGALFCIECGEKSGAA